MKQRSNSEVFQPKIESQISHMFRIPLTSIMGMVDILSETTLTQQQQESITIIQECAEQLLVATDYVCELLHEEIV